MNLQKSHIIIGIGGTGGNILKSIRKRLFTEVPSADERRKLPLGFVYIDSSMEHMKHDDPTWKVLGENTQLGKDSFLFIRGASLGDQLKNVDSYPGIKKWIGDRKIWDNLVGSVGDDAAAAQRRRLGRFLFSCAVSDYENILKKQVKDVKEKSGKTDVTFHIIAGLAGGTGSGSIVDVIAQTRKHFQENISSNLTHKILVYCLVPEQSPLPDWDKGYYHANGFAALQELNAMQVKRFIPHDVSGEYELVPLDDVSTNKVFNSCFLFTNANETGITVNTKNDLPNIVSDLIFHYMTMTVDENTTGPFDRAYTLENIIEEGRESDDEAETHEIANNELPVRTRKFNAFGIKRIVNPEEEIVEYFTYNFTRQSLLQFKYNNWHDDTGYRDQPKHEDYVSFVNDQATLERWLLSDAHLALSRPILQSEREQNWRTIQDEWNSVIPNLANAAWCKNEAKAITELARLCDECFDRNFRRVGVPEFYWMKEQAQPDIAKEICDTIQRDLFSQWQTGQKSVYEIVKLMDTLIPQTEIRMNSFDGKIVSCSNEIERKLAVKAQNEQVWGDMGVIAIGLGRRRALFTTHTVLLQQLYTKKTELESLRFSKSLLAEVINEMQLLNNEIKQFYETLSNALSYTDKEIAVRCREERLSQESFKGTVVKFYNAADVKDFNTRVVRNQKIQESQSSDARSAIAGLAGSERLFTALNEHATLDSIINIFLEKARGNAFQAHNELLSNKKQKLIGINIVEKLKEQYGSADRQTELNQFARNVMEYSGVFLTFNQTEVSRKLDNNDTPQPGRLIKIENTLISIPESPENMDFINNLIDAFKQNSIGARTIYVDNKSQRKNEITVINIISCFSLRMVNDIKILKQKYDLMLSKGANPERDKLVLHLEGDGSKYPNLFALTEIDKIAKRKEKEEEKRKEREKMITDYLPYLLMSCPLGIIKYQDKMDGTGKKAYCIMKTDEFGLPLPPLVLGEKFTQIIDSMATLSEGENLCGEIRADVQTQLAGDYLHVTKREELKSALVKLTKEVILPECKNNPGDPVFIKFKEGTTEAIKILME